MGFKDRTVDELTGTDSGTGSCPGEQMEQVRLSCGKRAEEPYITGVTSDRVFSIEELCYIINHDAYLLDESFASKELAVWISEECGLTELGDELEDAIKMHTGVEGYSRIILEYVGFYDQDVINEICAVIRDNASLTIYEKTKARADYMLLSGHISKSLGLYNELLEEIPEREKKVRASIWHNCGYAYARMFRYAEAARAYYCSYKTLPDDASLKQFLIALRLSKDERSYLEYVSEHPEFYEISQKAERSIAQATGAYEGTDEYRSVMALKVLREEDEPAASNGPYYERLDEIIKELKASYREMVMT